MSMYNMMHGTNPYAGLLVSLLGFKEPMAEIPRLRDCYVDGDSNIVVFTRTGGGNREYYDSSAASPGNADLRAKHGFIRSEDWDTDCTYAKWVYAPPQGSEELVRQLGDAGARMDPTEQFNQLLADMQSENPKPSTQAALERARPLVEQIAALVQEKE